jgi:hypothetical protein
MRCDHFPGQTDCMWCRNVPRVAIYSKELGVYLGGCMGLGFWSKLDSAGQESAVTFLDEEQAVAHMATWENAPLDCSFVSVMPDDGPYASAAACQKAGLPNWMN